MANLLEQAIDCDAPTGRGTTKGRPILWGPVPRRIPSFKLRPAAVLGHACTKCHD